MTPRIPAIPSNWQNATQPAVCPFCGEDRALDKRDYPKVFCVVCAHVWTVKS